jgi:hypothetical protein
MPVILATWEAEIRKMEVQSHPRQIVFEILSQKNPSQKIKKPLSSQVPIGDSHM